MPVGPDEIVEFPTGYGTEVVPYDGIGTIPLTDDDVKLLLEEVGEVEFGYKTGPEEVGMTPDEIPVPVPIGPVDGLVVTVFVDLLVNVMSGSPELENEEMPPIGSEELKT